MESVESAVELQNEQKGKLLKILGVTFGIAVTIGGMIGLGREARRTFLKMN